MKISKIAILAAAVCGLHFGTASAQQYNTQFDSAVVPASCCESASCDANGCDSMHGGGGLGLDCLDCLDCGDCCLGDPYQLFDEHYGWQVGGWTQVGYHSQGASNRFNDYPDGIRLHQAWLYAEKVADGSCGFDLGGRIDGVYGIDGPDTQAFGPNDDSWDQDWDNGGNYGWAIPQLYVEAAYGDLSVKAGHFYTIIGSHVVPAPDNFFYSHTYTMYNNEPFTHTGFLATYKASDALSLFGGYTFGWDSGFVDNGDNFLGGFSLGLTEDVNFTYATTIGRFGTNFGGAGIVEQGYMHSMVLNTALTENLNWISQYDVLSTESSVGGADVREGYAFVNFLVYGINDCTSIGARHEYFHRNVSIADAAEVDVNALTFGVNHRLNANLIVRPELRWDWDDNGAFGVNENNDASQTTFGMDAILTF